MAILTMADGAKYDSIKGEIVSPAPSSGGGGSSGSSGGSSTPSNLVNPGSVYQTYNPNTGVTTYGTPPASFTNSIVGTAQPVATPANTPATAKVFNASGQAQVNMKFYKGSVNGQTYYEALPGYNTPYGMSEVSYEEWLDYAKKTNTNQGTIYDRTLSQYPDLANYEAARNASSGYVVDDQGRFILETALAEEQKNANDPNMVNVGTATAPKYMPKGSPGLLLAQNPAEYAKQYPQATGLVSESSQKTEYTPLSPSALLRGTTLKETDLARTTGTNIYRRDLKAEEAKIGEFVKLYGKQPQSDADWRKFHDFVYENKSPFSNTPAGAAAGAAPGLTAPAATAAPAGNISPTIATPSGLASATANEQSLRAKLLAEMKSLASLESTALATEQNKLGLINKGNSITELETQIARETEQWDNRIAMNRDKPVDIRVIEGNEASLIRKKNLSLLPKIQLLAIKKEDYEKAEQLAKDNAEAAKNAKVAEIEAITMELGFLTADEQEEKDAVMKQIDREESLMSEGCVKFTPTTWNEYRTKNGINAGNETDYVVRVYNASTGQTDIWKKPAEAYETKIVKGSLVTYDKQGNIIKKEVVSGSGGNGSSSVTDRGYYTAQQKTKLKLALGDNWQSDATDEEIQEVLYPESEGNITEPERKRQAIAATNEVFGQVTGSDSKISPDNWNIAREEWRLEGYEVEDFDETFKKYINWDHYDKYGQYKISPGVMRD